MQTDATQREEVRREARPAMARYGERGFLIMDARYPYDRDRALVLETRNDIKDCGEELAASYGECVIVDANNGDWWTLIDAFGEVAEWSDEFDALICAQAEQGLDAFGNRLEADDADS